jgi:hypothetical protein
MSSFHREISEFVENVQRVEMAMDNGNVNAGSMMLLSSERVTR